MVFFEKADKKLIYPIEIEVSLNIYRIRETNKARLQSISSIYSTLQKSTLSPKIERHLINSLSASDSTDAFLEAWKAFEICVNQLFKNLKKKPLKDLIHNNGNGGIATRIKDIHDRSKNKQPFMDRFKMVSLVLHPDLKQANNDLPIVNQAKNDRGDYSHGKEINTEDLKTMELRIMTLTYTVLYLESSFR